MTPRRCCRPGRCGFGRRASPAAIGGGAGGCRLSRDGRAQHLAEQPLVAGCGTGGRGGVVGCARGLLDEHDDSGGQHAAVGHGFGASPCTLAVSCGYHRGRNVVEAPLHAGQRRGAGATGRRRRRLHRPSPGDQGHRGDDHAAAKVEHAGIGRCCRRSRTPRPGRESGPATDWAAVDPGRHPTDVAV